MRASITAGQTVPVVGGGNSGTATAGDAAGCGCEVEPAPDASPKAGREADPQCLKGGRGLRVLTTADVMGPGGRGGNCAATVSLHPRLATAVAVDDGSTILLAAPSGMRHPVPRQFVPGRMSIPCQGRSLRV